MSDCPSYLGIKINDRLQSEELINYDLLVFCPPQFNVTFWLPNWGQRSAKTFDVRLRDSQRSHVVYLTRLVLDATSRHRPTVTPPTSGDVHDERELPTVFAAIAGVTLTLGSLLLALFVRLRSPCTQSTHDVASRKNGRRCHVCAYVTVRVVYSVVVSFACVLLTLSVLLQPEVELMSTVDVRLSSDAWIEHVNLAAGNEALRQVRAARARHAACTQYVDQLYAAAVEHVGRVNSQCGGGGVDSGAMKRLETALRGFAGVTHLAVDEYRRHVSATVSTLTSVQTRHLARLYSNDWTNFAVGTFNKSDDGSLAGRRVHPLPDEVDASLSQRQVAFAAFIGIDVTRETRTWLDQFWHRFCH